MPQKTQGINDTRFDFRKPLVTRDGRDVRIYAIDGKGAHPVHGAIETDGAWSICDWDLCGWKSSIFSPSCCDLFYKPDRIIGWVYLEGERLSNAVFDSRSGAEHVGRRSAEYRGVIYIDSEVQN